MYGTLVRFIFIRIIVNTLEPFCWLRQPEFGAAWPCNPPSPTSQFSEFFASYHDQLAPRFSISLALEIVFPHNLMKLGSEWVERGRAHYIKVAFDVRMGLVILQKNSYNQVSGASNVYKT